MKLTIDHNSDMVYIEKHVYALPVLKNFLINHYPELVRSFFIRAIYQPGYQIQREVEYTGSTTTIQHNIYYNGRQVFTYDWSEILSRAERSILPLHDFIRRCKPLRKTSRRFPEQLPKNSSFFTDETI